MIFLIVGAVAALASLLTFFSGFGLGTVLLPAFSIFFPIHAAVALTAMVHFLNNAFKFLLVGRRADMRVVRKFGVPALFAAILGAWVLNVLSDLPPLFQYQAFGRPHAVLPVKLTIAVLIFIFALWEMLPRFKRIAVDEKFLALGGTASGFFGGLSGNQGALRSAFLIHCGLTKEAYIATGIVIACVVDAARLPVYFSHFPRGLLRAHAAILTVAVLCAFAGAWMGNRLLPKITMRSVQMLVTIMLVAVAMGLAAGLL